MAQRSRATTANTIRRFICPTCCPCTRNKRIRTHRFPQICPRSQCTPLPNHYHRNTICRIAQTTRPSRYHRHRHRNHFAQSHGSTISGHQHCLCRRRSRLYSCGTQHHRSPRTTGFTRCFKPLTAPFRKSPTQKNRTKSQIRPTYLCQLPHCLKWYCRRCHVGFLYPREPSRTWFR